MVEEDNTAGLGLSATLGSLPERDMVLIKELLGVAIGT